MASKLVSGRVRPHGALHSWVSLLGTQRRKRELGVGLTAASGMVNGLSGQPRKKNLEAQDCAENKSVTAPVCCQLLADNQEKN